MRRAFLMAGLGLAVLGTEGLAAQRTSATPLGPGVIAMRSYACGLVNLDRAAGLLADSDGAIALELISEGLLLDYQVLKRTWGDDWDLVELFAAVSEEDLRFALEELQLRSFVAPNVTGLFQSFAALCPRRKDNQYSVVTRPD